MAHSEGWVFSWWGVAFLHSSLHGCAPEPWAWSSQYRLNDPSVWKHQAHSYISEILMCVWQYVRRYLAFPLWNHRMVTKGYLIHRHYTCSLKILHFPQKKVSALWSWLWQCIPDHNNLLHNSSLISGPFLLTSNLLSPFAPGHRVPLCYFVELKGWEEFRFEHLVATIAAQVFFQTVLEVLHQFALFVFLFAFQTLQRLLFQYIQRGLCKGISLILSLP